MATLVEKLRRAREITVDSEGFRFTFRRPTDLEITEIKRIGLSERLLLAFVIGWGKTDGSPITEIDLGLPGGEPHPLDFDSEACVDFLADRQEMLDFVTKAIAESYAAHSKAMKEATKN